MRTLGNRPICLKAAAGIAVLCPALLLPGLSGAVFEKGGLLEGGPRAAALGGAVAASRLDAVSARGAPASLAYTTANYVQLAGGAASQASLSGIALGAGSRLEDIGLAGLLTRDSFSGGSEHTVGLGAGLPLTELPWVSLGAGIRGMYAKLGSDSAHAFGFDGSVMVRPPLPWRRLSLGVSAGVEDAFGELRWKGGLRDNLPTMTHFALAAGWLESLRLLAAVQRVESDLGGEDIFGAGIEYTVRPLGRALSLRSGIRDGEFRELSLCAGVGVRAGRYCLDYAVVRMTQSQGFLHLFSAGMTLGRDFLLQDAASGLASGGRIRPSASVIRVFSPFQTMRFSVDCPRRRLETVSSWSVVVMDAEGRAVWSVEGEGKPPSSLFWNFTTDGGEFAPAGEYTVQLLLEGAGTYRFLSPPGRFRLERPSGQGNP